jgi:dephospho-CoA kinase
MGRGKPMLVVGVTGGPGTGKSTVAGILEEWKAVVLDADHLAHEVMEPQKLAWRQTLQLFGDEIANADRTINRKKLAARIFRDDQARRQLEAIVHPRVVRRIQECLDRLEKNKRVHLVVLDVPLLIEAGMQGLVDALIVVTAKPAVQRQRLMARGWSEEEIARRIGAQMALSAKVALADYVIDTSQGLAATRTQLETLWQKLEQHKRKRRG